MKLIIVFIAVTFCSPLLSKDVVYNKGDAIALDVALFDYTLLYFDTPVLTSVCQRAGIVDLIALSNSPAPYGQNTKEESFEPAYLKLVPRTCKKNCETVCSFHLENKSSFKVIFKLKSKVREPFIHFYAQKGGFKARSVAALGIQDYFKRFLNSDLSHDRRIKRRYLRNKNLLCRILRLQGIDQYLFWDLSCRAKRNLSSLMLQTPELGELYFSYSKRQSIKRRQSYRLKIASAKIPYKRMEELLP